MLDDLLEILGTFVEIIIECVSSKRPKLGIWLMTGFVLLCTIAFVAFLVWNCIDLFFQGSMIGAVILGVLALIGIISGIVFTVHFHKKGWD